MKYATPMAQKVGHMNKPLTGLKVVELATVLAGPTVGMFLAELGAEVIKIENPNTGGDTTRHWKLPNEDPKVDHCAYFCSVNWGKEHLFIDLKNENGKQQVYGLIAKADVLLTNFRKGDGAKLGFDTDTLFNLNPKLIVGNITGYGSESRRPAFDVVLQAETGYMYMNGHAACGPAKMPVALIDVLAAHQLKEGLLLALLERARSGKGSVVSVSLYDAAISALTNQASNWLMACHIPKAMGSLHPNIAPYGEILTTADGRQVVLAVGNEKQFIALCEALELNDLPDDDRFSSEQQRLINRTELHEFLQTQAGNLKGDELLRRFDELSVPAGEIKNLEQVFEESRAKNMILEETMADGSVSKRVSDIAFEIWQK